MTNFSREQYEVAIADWTNLRGDFSALESLIPTNHIFHIPYDHIQWIKGNNEYKDFCTEIGLYNGQILLILVPLDSKGQRKVMEEYYYSVLSPLKSNLQLTEIQQFTVINNAVLSDDLKKIDRDSDTYFPVNNKPVMPQDKALDAIEQWRDQGSNWFYFECSEYQGSRIFQRFYVPAENLTPNQPGKTLESFICSFGLKYSDIYQRMLVTLIFISFYKTELQTEHSLEMISNTYDWSQPCPPICRV